MIKRAHAVHSVETTRIDGTYQVEMAKCGVLSGVEKTSCESSADATRAADQARVTAERDAALVAASRH